MLLYKSHLLTEMETSVHGSGRIKHSNNSDYIDSSDVKSYTFAEWRRWQSMSKIIKFICGEPSVAKHYPVVPASQAKPDWYKKDKELGLVSHIRVIQQ